MSKTIAIVCLIISAGCILGCSRKVEVVDTPEQAQQRARAAKHFEHMQYSDLSEPLGAPKKPNARNNKPAATTPKE